jgi:hypothetical protein
MPAEPQPAVVESPDPEAEAVAEPAPEAVAEPEASSGTVPFRQGTIRLRRPSGD